MYTNSIARWRGNYDFNGLEYNKKGELAPVYLLVGEESYFIDETIKRLKEAMGPEEDLEMSTFDLEEVPVDAVMDEADTIPFSQNVSLLLLKMLRF